MFTSNLIAFALFVGSALAAPPAPPFGSPARSLPKTHCPAQAPTAAMLNGLALPTDSAPIFWALGVGVQNYTCSDAGVFTSAGAVAKLYDISCLQGNSIFNNVQNLAVNAPDRGLALIQSALAGTTEFLGDHYFGPNPTGAVGISPVFDFRTGFKKGDPNGFVTLKKAANVASTGGAKNVDLLALDALAGFGTLAKHVYRLDTALGQPPASCTPKATTSIKYAAKYCFFG